MRTVLITFILITVATAAYGQGTSPTVIQDRAAQYILGDRDQILMQVNIWGYVAKPGQYWVPRNTDLISLISFAGGPRDGANLGQVRILREGQPGSRQDGEDGSNGHKKKVPILKVDVKRYIETGEGPPIPVLQGGDTILITPTFGQKFRNTLGYVSTVAVIAQIAWWITLIARN